MIELPLVLLLALIIQIKGEQERIARLPYKLPKKLTEILDIFKNGIYNKNLSIVIVTDGRSGTGKTTLSMQEGLYCDPTFSLAKVFFTPDDFLKGLEKAKKGDVLIFDEAMLISSRASMSQINKMIIIAMSMIRSKNIIVIFNINSIFDLDKNLALYRCDLLLHVYSEGLGNRGRFMAFFKASDNRDRIKELYLYGKKYYSYSKPKSNFNTRFSKHFVVDEKEYERKKQIGVNQFLKYGASSLNLLNKDKMSRNEYIRWLRNNTKLTYNAIAEIGGLSARQVKNIVKIGEDETNVKR